MYKQRKKNQFLISCLGSGSPAWSDDQVVLGGCCWKKLKTEEKDYLMLYPLNALLEASYISSTTRELWIDLQNLKGFKTETYKGLEATSKNFLYDNKKGIFLFGNNSKNRILLEKNSFISCYQLKADFLYNLKSLF